MALELAPTPIKVELDCNLIYRETDDCDTRLNMLDVYFRNERNKDSRKPVVLFIHGGDWSGGDKKSVFGVNCGMAHWFVSRGWVFVAANFQLAHNPLSSKAEIPDQLDDLAKAMKWVAINIRRYGGDPARTILVGFSSGAHLAALLASDPAYLNKYRLTHAMIKQIICLDGAHFDIPLALRVLTEQSVGLPHQDTRVHKLHRLMGREEERQLHLSPAAHALEALTQIRFLLLSTGLWGSREQSFSRIMNEHFLTRLNECGVLAEHRHLPSLGHKDLLRLQDKNLQQTIETTIFEISGTDHPPAAPINP